MANSQLKEKIKSNTGSNDSKTAANADVEKSKPRILEHLKQMENQIKLALPEHLKPERINRIIVSALSDNPKLGLCDPITVLSAIMQAAQLGLEVNSALGHVYIVPFYNNKKKCYECKFMFGYQGLMQLAYNTNRYQLLYAKAVYKNDKFEYWYGLNPDLVHKPSSKKEGEPLFYYAVYKMVNGCFDFSVWTKEDVLSHAVETSQSYDKTIMKFKQGSAWDNNFSSMALKTVLKAVLKTAPKSVELSMIIDADEKVKYGISQNMLDVVGVYNEEGNIQKVDEEKPPEVPAEPKKKVTEIKDANLLIDESSSQPQFNESQFDSHHDPVKAKEEVLKLAKLNPILLSNEDILYFTSLRSDNSYYSKETYEKDLKKLKSINKEASLPSGVL